MALPSSGAMRMGADVNVELSKTATTLISLGQSDVRALYSVASGAIRLAADGYGKSSGPTAGYFAGGALSGLPAPNTGSQDKFTFSTEAISNITAVSARNGLAGVNSATKGYWTGGAYGTYVDATTFSNGSVAGLSATMVQGFKAATGVNPELWRNR